VAQYETDEEKVEAIKQWWKENGLAVAAGLVFGLVAVFGWRAWQDHQENRAQQASATFEQLLAVASRSDADAAAAGQLTKRLHEDFGGTPYAALGSLVMARVALAGADREAAKEALGQAIKEAPDPALAGIAALRLARILIDEQDLEGADAILAGLDEGGAFAGEIAALRGDIAAARGDLEAARSAYGEALAAGASQAQLIEIKLANLPSAG
jgi:predicted negative regulator of RcsB-dependent stress response